MIIQIVKKYWGYILLVIIIIFLVIKIQFKNSKIEHLETQNNISLTLLDSLKIYKNKLNTLTYEKQSFNVKFNALEKEYDRLDKNSKHLVDKIRILEKEKSLISASNIHQSVIIDSLINNWPVIDEINHTLTFHDSTTFLQYNMLVYLQPPSLNIKKLSLPNELYISHKFTENGVSVKVVNSNDKYFKVNDITSYIIPLEGNKKVPVKRYFMIGGIGVFIGGTTALLLFN
jgi:hypothetical protein